MAFSNIDFGWLQFPDPSLIQENAGSNYSTVLDATTEYEAWIGPVHKTGSITQIGVSIVSVGTDGDMDLRLETIDGSGYPSGTLWSANTDVTVAITNAGDQDTIVWGTLTSAASVTANDWVCAKARPSATGSAFFTTRGANVNQLGCPYNARNIGSPVIQTRVPPIYLRYSDGSLVRQPFTYIHDLLYQLTFNAANLAGNRFRLPFDANCIGFWVSVLTNENCTVKLFDSDDSTVLASETVYEGMCNEINTAGTRRHFWSAGDVSLSAGTWYRIAIISDVPNSNSLWAQTLDPDATEGIESSWWIDPDEPNAKVYRCYDSDGTPTGTGDWTNVVDEFCHIGVIMDKLSEPGNPPNTANVLGRWSVHRHV